MIQGLNRSETVKHIIIINVIFYVVTHFIFPQLFGVLSMYYPDSAYFKPWQVLTHMFMHGGFFHIFMNMYGLYLLGTILERVWGPQRFLFFYFSCGFGALIIHLLSYAIQFQLELGTIMPSTIGGDYRVDIPMLGASGAIFGILVAFGMLFPNTQLMIIPIPVPIKAKWFVIGYVVISLLMGFNIISVGGIAHWAHLGGALTGFIMVKIWNRDKTTFY